MKEKECYRVQTQVRPSKPSVERKRHTIIYQALPKHYALCFKVHYCDSRNVPNTAIRQNYKDVADEGRRSFVSIEKGRQSQYLDEKRIKMSQAKMRIIISIKHGLLGCKCICKLWTRGISHHQDSLRLISRSLLLFGANYCCKTEGSEGFAAS